MSSSAAPTDAQIEAWLGEEDFSPQEIERLPGDVSVRSYMRLRSSAGETRILSYCPPALRDACERFVRTTELMQSIGVRVPRIDAADPEAGWILLEDLGGPTIFDLGLSERELRPYYRDAAQILDALRSLDPKIVGALSPDLGAELMIRELDQTWELFLEPSEMAGTAADREALRRALREVCHSIGERDLVPCHRDFMLRNLMPIEGERVALIDHQDLRLGPKYYDLASLLNDSRFASDALERTLLDRFVRTEADLADYRRAALQRTLKAIGTFVAFHRRGNSRHLPLVEPTLRRAADLLALVPETAPLAPTVGPLWRDRAAIDLLD